MASKISGPFDGANEEIATRMKEMTLHDAYVGSMEAKQAISTQHLQYAISIYDAHKIGERSPHLVTPNNLTAAAKQNDALQYFVKAVDAALAENNIDRAADPAAFDAAIRRAYGKVIEAYGIERVDPAVSGGVAKYDEWFKIYNKSFPIRGERETKSDMRELLEERMTNKGYGEVALGLRDPFTGKQAGGVQALVVARAAAGMFTYAFLDPAYQGLGLGRTLVEGTRHMVADAVKQYNPKSTWKPAVYLEKNKPSLMPLENIVLDSTGIDVQKLPRDGSNLAKGAISQSERDARWSSLGAKEIENAGYIQPSLDGVTAVKDEHQRKIAIRYLQNDPLLTPSEREQAAMIIKTALNGKAEHCPLALCAFVDKDQTTIPAAQTEMFLSDFYQTSCLDTDRIGLEQDIFAQATLGKLRQQSDANGNLPLIKVEPYAGPIAVTSFAQAEQVTRALLKVAPLQEIQAAARAAKAGKPETPYAAWLEKYQHEIRADLGIKQVGPQKAVRQSLRHAM